MTPEPTPGPTPEQDKLKDQISGLLRAEVKDLWDVEDSQFLVQLADDMAREKILAAGSANPAEHQKNLEFLAATLQGEVARRKLRLNKKGREVFVRVVSMAIRTLAMTALSV